MMIRACLLLTTLFVARSAKLVDHEHLLVGFEWELKTTMVTEIGYPSRTIVKSSGAKGVPQWTTHQDLGHLKWTGDMTSRGRETIELITGPLRHDQIEPMVNAMKADLELINEPNEGTSKLQVAGPFVLDVNEMCNAGIFGTPTTQVQEDQIISRAKAHGGSFEPVDTFCSMTEPFDNMPGNIYLTGVKPSENIFSASQHSTIPIRFGLFHTTYRNQFAYDMMAAVSSIADELGCPDNDQLKDTLYTAALRLSTEKKDHRGRWTGVNHRALSLAPRVNTADLFHLIEDSDVRQAIVDKRVEFSAVARPDNTPNSVEAMVKMIKNSFGSKYFFANDDAEFVEGDLDVGTQTRPHALAYKTPFLHKSNIYFLVEDRANDLIPKFDDLPKMMAAFERVFAGNYKMIRTPLRKGNPLLLAGIKNLRH